MTRYLVRWEQTVSHEVEVEADSVTEARTLVVTNRHERPRVTGESARRSFAVLLAPEPSAPSLFDIEPEPQPGAVGADHPETSQAAARSTPNRLRFKSQRANVLVALLDHGPATAADIADRLGISRNQIATRLGELRTIGWVDYARDSWGKVITAPTSSDAEGMVQEITLAGEVALRTAGVEARDAKGDKASEPS